MAAAKTRSRAPAPPGAPRRRKGLRDDGTYGHDDEDEDGGPGRPARPGVRTRRDRPGQAPPPPARRFSPAELKALIRGYEKTPGISDREDCVAWLRSLAGRDSAP